MLFWFDSSLYNSFFVVDQTSEHHFILKRSFSTEYYEHYIRMLLIIILTMTNFFVFSVTSADPTTYEIQSFPTKNTPVLHLHFTRRNLLLAGGPYNT